MNYHTKTSLQYIFVNVHFTKKLNHSLLCKLTGKQSLAFTYKPKSIFDLIPFLVVEEMEVVQHYYFSSTENYARK